MTRSLHQTIKKVSDDVEAMRFNTAVSSMMVFVNMAKEQGTITKESFLTFLRVLCLFAPHLANELFEKMGEHALLETKPWPVFDPAMILESEIEMAVQVNGKARATIRLAPDADEATALAAARANESVQKHLDGMEIKKVIYVPGRILNLVG